MLRTWVEPSTVHRSPSTILYFDLEVDPRSKAIREYGALLNGDRYRGVKRAPFAAMADRADTICGHNILAHDLPVLRKHKWSSGFFKKAIIDTLLLSALLFPKKPYHYLVKDYQLEGGEINNPLADACLSKELLGDLWQAFQQLTPELQSIYYSLLHRREGFDGFFRLTAVNGSHTDPEKIAHLVKQTFAPSVCQAIPLSPIIQEYPVELAFALALISVDDTDSLLPPWVQYQFPYASSIIDQLRVNCPGNQGCSYCDQLSPLHGLQRFFGFDAFRAFEEDQEKPLQQQVVEAALDNQSFIAVFPTGGGKSLTFQLPALMKGVANRSLTVVISPLQSLMKDQVDVLRQRHDITSAVTINGMLSPLERSEAIARVEEGGANLLYISPESLRSRTILRLLLRRKIDRFVIDEAHCFSSWGQDFRVDYLYIGKFVKKLQQLKGRTIPVSCFTATAKPAVIDDISDYFQQHLGLELQRFQTGAKRKNLHYFVLKAEGKEEKYHTLKDLLHAEEGAKIVYVARVKTAEGLAEKLRRDGFLAKAYHGKLDREEKIRIQNDFMWDNTGLELIVATSAFGMGIDKENVKVVIHYTISDSLESYMQESGRAGRKPDLQAKCYVLFEQEDLNRHFQLLNLSKLSHKEVYQIWQGIKEFRRKQFTKSALEIAKKAGWDTEMRDLETRVKVALSALEEVGYVRREENVPKIFAQSILVKNVAEARRKMEAGIHHFTDEAQMEKAQRIFSTLISRAKSGQDTRVDHIAENLGLERSEVSSSLQLFKQLGILSNDKDLSAYYFTVQGQRNSQQVFERVAAAERQLMSYIFPGAHNRSKTIYLREVNEWINEQGVSCNIALIRDLLNYWSQVHYIKKERIDKVNGQYKISLLGPAEKFAAALESRLHTAAVGMQVFRDRILPQTQEDKRFPGKQLMQFSVLDLKLTIEAQCEESHPLPFYEFILLYFHHLKIIELKDGLLIFYNPMKITRSVEDNRKRYTREDYQQLAQFYESKTEQIHIVGEYAKKQLQHTSAATQFVQDYFSLPYEEFIARYFRGRKGAIKRPVTEEKFARIFGSLSAEQLQVVKDSEHDNILVAAGPGSGKTRVLVHKVASLLLMEDVKPEQFLMLTFSRPAALEFKSRLYDLVGATAFQVDIFTYHGFAFQLTGRMGDLERSRNILEEVTRAIGQEDVALERIKNKSVVVVDEYQDVSQQEYDFLMAIVRCAEKIRVIAAGDDDQNIYEFRGSSHHYMRAFIQRQDAAVYYLRKNYRARYNLLEFTNRYVRERLSPDRLKNGIELIAHHQQPGRIDLIQYDAKHLIEPLVAHLTSQHLKGSIAVLTHTNEEALMVTSMLRRRGFPARLIMEKAGFSLRNLLELRTFSYYLQKMGHDEFGLIPEYYWQAQKEKLPERFAGSQNLDLAQRIIADFEQAYPKKFQSEWKSFLQEIRPEDFYPPDRETILVATMHKSKGKEFDHVAILLRQYPAASEEKKRVLYVAMTRAKQSLFVHSNSLKFSLPPIPGLSFEEDHHPYPPPDILTIACGMKDVFLGYIKQAYVQQHIKTLLSGQILHPHPDTPEILQDNIGHPILKFSRSFTEKLRTHQNRGYRLHEANAQYLVLWYEEASGKEFRVVLPELTLRKDPLL